METKQNKGGYNKMQIGSEIKNIKDEGIKVK